MITDEDLEGLVDVFVKSPVMGKQILKHLLCAEGNHPSFGAKTAPYKVQQVDDSKFEIVGWCVIAIAFNEVDAQLICSLLNSRWVQVDKEAVK